jgi:lysophospholipase
MTVLLAQQDLVVDSEAAAAFAAGLPQAEIQWIAGARHELLQETPAIQDRVWAALERAFGSR